METINRGKFHFRNENGRLVLYFEENEELLLDWQDRLAHMRMMSKVSVLPRVGEFEKQARLFINQCLRFMKDWRGATWNDE